MKKVLFIAYHFPPIAGGGTFRSLKFVKYLPQYGWLPTVLTVDTNVSMALDEKGVQEIPQKVDILRARQFEWFYLHILFSKLGVPGIYDIIKDKFLIPDTKIGWYKKAIKQAQKELCAKKYDLIFSTSPTIVSHMIARRLSAQFHIPWVADFRDFWTAHPQYPFANTKRDAKEKRIERSILHNSDKIITAFNQLKEKFLTNYPDLNRNKIETIYNGFDFIDKLQRREKNKQLNIVYTGSFYGNYNPNIFLKSLKQLYQEFPDLEQSIELTFIGNIENKVKNNSCVKINYKPFLNSQKLKKYIDKADLLFIILPENSGLPGKIFTYFSYLKPIFAIVPEGETKILLEKSNLAYFADPKNPKEIKTKIMMLWKLWGNSQLDKKPDLEFIRSFNRKKLTKSLANTFDEVT